MLGLIEETLLLECVLFSKPKTLLFCEISVLKIVSLDTDFDELTHFTLLKGNIETTFVSLYLIYTVYQIQ